MKTKEELNALKKEVEAMNKKLAELTEEELKQVSGGDRTFDVDILVCIYHGNYFFCPYKADYTKCPHKGVHSDCDIETWDGRL